MRKLVHLLDLTERLCRLLCPWDIFVLKKLVHLLDLTERLCRLLCPWEIFVLKKLAHLLDLALLLDLYVVITSL